MARPRIPSSGFTNYTLDEIRKTLQAFGYDEGKIVETVETIRKERALLKGQKVKKARAVTNWRYLRTPLKHEHKVIKLALSYIERKEIRGEDLDEADTARREAYTAYKMVVEKLLLQFDLYVETHPSDTPLQVLRREQSEGKCNYVTRTDHWSDWVPEKVKDRVTALFEDIPYKARAKAKLPFEQVVPMGLARSRRRTLEEAMAKEEATLQATLNMYEVTDDMSTTQRDEVETAIRSFQSKIDDLRQAQRILHRKRDNTALPLTWHGLLKLQGEG